MDRRRGQQQGLFTLHSSHFKHQKENIFAYEPQTFDRRTTSSKKYSNNYEENEERYDEYVYYNPDGMKPLRSRHSSQYRELSSEYQRPTKGNHHFHVPVFSSERVIVTKEREVNPTDYYSKYSNEYYLSKGSQRQIIHSMEHEIYSKFHKAEKIIHAKLLKDPFHRWKDNSDNPSRIKNHVKYYYPSLHDKMVDNSFFYHRGISFLFQFFYFKYVAILLKSFTKWKQILRIEYWMKRKFFDKWNIKISLWIELKMKGRRFLKLMKPIANKLYKQTYYHHWYIMIMKWKNLSLMKFTFRIWKYSILAYRKWKRYSYRKAIKSLQFNRQFYLSRDLSKITWIINRRLQKYWKIWIQIYKKKFFLKRFFQQFLYTKIYLQCWNTWKAYVRPAPIVFHTNEIPTSPIKYSKHEPSTPISTKKAVFQSEYRQVIQKKKKKVQYINWKVLSPMERIEYRLQYVKHLDKKHITSEQKRHEYFNDSLAKLSSTDLKNDLIIHRSTSPSAASVNSSKDKDNHDHDRDHDRDRGFPKGKGTSKSAGQAPTRGSTTSRTAAQPSRYNSSSNNNNNNNNSNSQQKHRPSPAHSQQQQQEQPGDEERKRKENLLCRHSLDHCLYCNYCQPASQDILSVRIMNDDQKIKDDPYLEDYPYDGEEYEDEVYEEPGDDGK
jgi:hypothetical protein